MFKFGKGCPACPFIREKKYQNQQKKQWKLNSYLDWNTYNVVYAIKCKKDNCNRSYIGETKRMLKFRLADQYGYVRIQRLDTPTGAHFNSPGHTLCEMSCTELMSNDHLLRCVHLNESTPIDISLEQIRNGNIREKIEVLRILQHNTRKRIEHINSKSY